MKQLCSMTKLLHVTSTGAEVKVIMYKEYGLQINVLKEARVWRR